MTATITREVLENHLKCRYKGHLKLAGERGGPSDYELLLTEAREWVRQAATEKLLARHGKGEVLSVTVWEGINYFGESGPGPK